MSGQPTWVSALQRLSIDGAHLSAEELVDVCLLLTLSERVHVLALDPELETPQLLGRSLRDLGYRVGLVGVDIPLVASPSDTVVALLGPEPVADPTVLRSVIARGAVLTAITTSDAGPIVDLVDAAVTLPSFASTADQTLRRMMFDLVASMVVEAIGRELSGRHPQPTDTLLHHAASRAPAGQA